MKIEILQILEVDPLSRHYGKYYIVDKIPVLPHEDIYWKDAKYLYLHEDGVWRKSTFHDGKPTGQFNTYEEAARVFARQKEMTKS